MNLTNKIAIVTGGSRGIGLAISKAYVQAGATVIIANRNQAEAEKALAQLRAENAAANVAAFICDMGDLQQLNALVDWVISEYGRIDILVNNAGVFEQQPLDEVAVADWDKTMNINLRAPYFLTQAVVPHMQRQGGGHIICITSMAAHKALKSTSLYCMSKAALNMMVKTFATELAADKIHVNSIAPGAIATDMTQHLQDNKEWVGVLEETIPSGRAFIPADELAQAAVFLASDAASAMHGAELLIDDGWTL